MSSRTALTSRQLRPFQRFVRTEAAGGLLLFGCVCAALGIANSPWADSYHRLWTIHVVLGIPDHGLTLTLHQWINDGLMAVFFLLVGLEIKRELLGGELASSRQAVLPIVAAIGGMVMPAALYWAVNGTGAGARGWAIPMATDIAFALGALSLIASRAPTGAKVFLAALAIVDDMGAVLVIAIFYTRAVAWRPLTLALVILAALAALNVLHVRRLTPYLVLGAVLWLFVHESGIHATVAGVLLALAIPTRTAINATEFSHEARRLLDDFDRTETGDYIVLTSKGQQEAIDGLERASEAVTAPLLRLEHALHGFSAYLVMPLFALSNAGVALGGSSADVRVVVGIVLGLAVGKPLGIMAAAGGAAALKLATPPNQVSWGTLHGCAWLGGIGFTMSLFIATLAFEGTPLLDAAKTGVLSGSLIALVVAGIVLRVTLSSTYELAPPPTS